jgi:hypothetical protein
MNKNKLFFITKRFLAILVLINLKFNMLDAIFPANIFRLGTIDQTIEFPTNRKYLLQVGGEGTFDTVGHNSLGNRVNVMQIWQPSQNSLTMLRGFSSDTQIGKLDSLLNSANDDGVRGHVTPTAQFQATRFNFLAKKHLPFNLFANILLPVFRMKLSDLEIIDQTKDISFTDQLVKTHLTNNLANIVYNLGDKLDIVNGWEKSGIGDIELTLAWQKGFKQAKPVLKEVLLGLYGGLTIPTGVRQNEDQIMPIPFGNDGSAGLIFGGNIQLQWWNFLRAGVNTNFMELFNSNRPRRIKTDYGQSDLILLAKTQTTKEWGFTQQYALYLELFNIYKYVSLRTTYNYIKHNQDKLNIFNQSYSSAIANSAISLQEWTQHCAVFALFYESDRAVAKLFYQYPFNGKNVIQSNIFGGYLGIYF